QGKSLWWLFEVAHGKPIGCFINRNHFAGFVAMLCAVSVGLFVDGLSRRRYLEASLWTLCFLAMSMAVFMSMSRGAWVAYVLAGFVLVAVMMFRRRFKAGICLLAVILVVLAAVVLPARLEFGDRIESTLDSSAESSLNFRIATWRDSVRILPDYPFLGTGANGLRMILPQYRLATTRREADFAENEYVQVPVELGLCGLLLVVSLCWMAARKWWMNNAAGAISPAVGLAVGGAVAVVMVHGAVDFAIRVPLYFVVFCSLVGLVVGSSVDRHVAEDEGQGRFFADGFIARFTIPVVGLLLVGTVSLYGKAPHDFDSDEYLGRAQPQQLINALEWSPTSWRAWYSLGAAAVSLGTPDETRFGERCMSRAAEYNPNSYFLWRELAVVRLRMNDRTGAEEAYRRGKALRSWVRVPGLE
ncbi:MAG: O-antigen ligase family protein, partial [bacterium]